MHWHLSILELVWDCLRLSWLLLILNEQDTFLEFRKINLGIENYSRPRVIHFGGVFITFDTLLKVGVIVAV